MPKPTDRRNINRDFDAITDSLPQAFNDGFGIENIIAERDATLKAAKPISIYKITPDASQPRRAIPSAARAYWTGDPASIPEVFSVWIGMAEQEAQHPIVVGDYLSTSYDPETTDADIDQVARGPIESGLLDFLNFCRTLMDGLNNPITVTKTAPDQYRIETGERRWLGFHMLYMITQDAKWQTIPARDIGKPDVWRQASENSARSDLNAIGRARQIALLIMDLYKAQGAAFRQIEEYAGECDRLFYAQVADGEEWRIPRGQGQRILAATGLKDETQIRAYRMLLRAPDELWIRADDENMFERAIRTLMKQNNNGDTVVNATVREPKPVPAPKLVETLRRTYETGDKQTRAELVNLVKLWLVEIDIMPTLGDD